MADAMNAPMTASTQWLERTLDDSANRRICLPESFLATDGVLRILDNVTAGMRVNEAIIARDLETWLPFMATENIMMDAVRRGGDRQELHERIREHSMAAARQVKMEGGQNDLIARIAADPMFGVTEEELQGILSPEKYTGCAAMQTEDFLKNCVQPVLDRYQAVHAGEAKIKV